MQDTDPTIEGRVALWRVDLDGADRRIEALIQWPPDPDRPESLDYGRRLAAIRDAHGELRLALQLFARAVEVELAAADIERRLVALQHDLALLEQQVAQLRG